MLDQSSSNLTNTQYDPVSLSMSEKTQVSELHEDPAPSPEERQMENSKPSNGTDESSKDSREETSKCLASEDHQREASKEEIRSDAPVEDGRERLKRHRSEMAGRVWIPEKWGQESLLKDWIDCSAFDSSLAPSELVSARQALVEECRRANSGRMRIENRC